MDIFKLRGYEVRGYLFGACLHLSLIFQAGFSSKRACLAPPETDTKQKKNMESSRSDAKEAILSLLLSSPNDIRCTYYTIDELVRLLKRGGASPSLEVALVRSSLQHVPTRHEVKIQRRRPEKIPGLDVAKPFCRFSRMADSASPRSQRSGKRSLPTTTENHFQNDESVSPISMQH